MVSLSTRWSCWFAFWSQALWNRSILKTSMTLSLIRYSHSQRHLGNNTDQGTVDSYQPSQGYCSHSSSMYGMVLGILRAIKVICLYVCLSLHHHVHIWILQCDVSPFQRAPSHSGVYLWLEQNGDERHEAGKLLSRPSERGSPEKMVVGTWHKPSRMNEFLSGNNKAWFCGHCVTISR